MNTRHHTILAVLVAACAQPERGIDRSVITGAVLIPPYDLTEDEVTPGANDSWEEGSALDLGAHGPRFIRVSGSVAAFGGTDTADFDHYRFTPLADGTTTLRLTWDDAPPEGLDTGDIAPDEVALLKVVLFDPAALDEEGAPIPLFEANTVDSYGTFEAELPVVANTTYAVQIQGIRSDLSSLDYELVLGGFDPNGTTTFVAAWTEDDPADRGLLVGGTAVYDYELDEDTLTWSGEYTINDIRSVVTEEIGAEAEAKDSHDSGDTGHGDSGDPGDSGTTDGTDGTDDSGGTDGADDSGGTDGATDGTGGTDTGPAEEEDEPKTRTTVNEKLNQVYLYAGTFPALTGAPGPGVLYATEPLAVQLQTNELAEHVVKGKDLRLDDLLPIPVGWTTVEVEPNDVEIDDEYAIIAGEAQLLPVASGPGLVDVIRGTLSIAEADPQWTGDNDGYTFTVEEPLTAAITLDWDGDAHNVDLNLNEANGALLAVGWDPEDVQPETLLSDDFGVTFQPGVEYTLVVLPWAGPVAELPYTMSIEWFAAP